jgi:hypothetical protein
MLGERAEEDGAVDGGGVALEVVERHVRIGRRRQLGEQTGEGGRQQLGITRRRRQRRQILGGGRGVGEAGLPQRPREAAVVAEETVRDD